MVKKSTFPSMGFKGHGLPSFLRSKSRVIDCEYQAQALLADPMSHHAQAALIMSDSSKHCASIDTLSSRLIYAQPRSRSLDNDRSNPAHKTILFSDPTPSSTQTRSTPFHGLPPEIIQHIAGFMSFSTLFLVYKSFPKIHRPLLQQILDHSLALMVLTLEIRQQRDIEHLPGTNTNVQPVLYDDTTLRTKWRATDFDLEQWTVEFQLEEKLGLQMAAKRRHAILQQQEEIQHTSSSCSNSGLCSLGSSNPPSKRAHMAPEDIEYMIWKARSRRMSPEVGTTTGNIGSGTGVATEEDAMQSLLMETPQEPSSFDNNFFHCNGSDRPPTLSSATVSFKANRNSPAPWVSLRSELGPDHSSSDESLSRTESLKTICARERIAAFQQNRVLQRSLAKMVHDNLCRTEFLPLPVELETSDLGQKRVEAFLLPHRPMSISEHESRRSSQELPSSSSSSTSFSGSTVSLSLSNQTSSRARRHSWHVTEPSEAPFTHTRHTSIASTIKKLFKASSSASSSGGRISRRSSLDLDNNHCSCPIVGHKSNFWSSMISSRASTSSRSLTNWSNSEDCLVHGHFGCRRTVHITSTPALAKDRWGLGIKRKRSLPGSRAIEDTNPEEGEGEQEKETCKTVVRPSLFEFQYGVRHNYMQTRLEGERVVRPTLFSCSLDFFMDEA
ncbi:hypothetical protein CPB97_005358 [Podila verticillata]|nr:hypothetical protein CPB97_005358 [Podila verticillata]